MNLQDVLDLNAGDSVMVTKYSRMSGGQLAISLVNQLEDDKPYKVDKIDKFTHKNEDEEEIVDRANIYLKGFAGLRFNPVTFEICKEK